MARLLYIRGSDNTLLLLGIDEEGESVGYRIPRALYAEIGSPVKGEDIPRDALAAIKCADERYRAEKKALSLLSYSDKNERTLTSRLVAAGFPKETAEECSRNMVALGYIDEERQLRRIITDEANLKLRGPMKIIPALVSKGYSSSEVKRVMHLLCEEGVVDFKNNAKRLLQKRLPDESDLEQKRAFLYKNGYKI